MKRIGILALALCMLCSSTLTAFATEEKQIGVYAEYAKTAIRVTESLENREASVELEEGIRVEVTNAPAKAATVSVIWIPETEDAWKWLESCLTEDMVLQGAYGVALADEEGEPVSNRGTKLSVPGEADMVLYGISADGSVTSPACYFADGCSQFTADGSDYYVFAREKVDHAVAKVGDREYATLEKALTAAESGDVVQLMADVVVEGTVKIAEGVTLDLGDHTLTADHIYGVNGSFLTGTPEVAKLIVAQENIILGQDGYINSKGQYILPIWDPSQNCYLFSQFVVNTDPTKNRGLTIDEEKGELYFQFKHQATRNLNNGLLADGASDNGLSVVIRLEWETENGTASQEFCYNDAQIGKVTGSNDYTFRLTGYGQLNIRLEDLKVQALIVTDSGATAFGAVWTQENSVQ